MVLPVLLGPPVSGIHIHTLATHWQIKIPTTLHWDCTYTVNASSANQNSCNTPLPLQWGIGINSPYEVQKLLAFFGANIHSERQQFDKYHTLPFFFELICSKNASTPQHKKNDTLNKLAAALYSQTTVKLSPSNLVKLLVLWGCREKNIHW